MLFLEVLTFSNEGKGRAREGVRVSRVEGIKETWRSSVRQHHIYSSSPHPHWSSHFSPSVIQLKSRKDSGELFSIFSSFFFSSVNLFSTQYSTVFHPKISLLLAWPHATWLKCGRAENIINNKKRNEQMVLWIVWMNGWENDMATAAPAARCCLREIGENRERRK